MHFVSDVSVEEIRRERNTARVLRDSPWWKRKLSRGRCYYCDAQVPPKELTMDHIVPIVRGGKSVKNNVVTACKSCNNKKKHLLPIEWEEYLYNL
jgi:5-methylcytosine-specific restriction endonuclease McrA